MEAAKASSITKRLEGSRQESITGEYSPGRDTHIKQSGEVRGGRNIDSRQEAAIMESQENIQAICNRDGHQSSQSQNRTDNSNKETEIYQQHQRISYTNTRNVASRTIAVHHTQNRQSVGNPS